MNQPSFFDLSDRHKKLDEKDPLTHLNKLISWEDFRSTLEKVRPTKKKMGRPAFDGLLMFKILILQSLYNVSDDEIEFQIRDRYSFCRFLGLMPEDRIPDAKTIWLFREQLTKANLLQELFYDFELQLQSKGFIAKRGQIVDASFVEAPRQRNKREDNAVIKNGGEPEHFKENPNIRRQKDLDARWTKKNDQTHYGYKNHIEIDNEHKLIREYEVTSAEVHDSQVFLELLSDNDSNEVWADSAYRSDENEIALDAMEYRSQVHEKGSRASALTKKQKKTNKRKSKTRARVEHVFGSMVNEQGGMFVRTIGLARANTKIGLMNLAYNIRRTVTLLRQGVPAI